MWHIKGVIAIKISAADVLQPLNSAAKKKDFECYDFFMAFWMAGNENNEQTLPMSMPMSMLVLCWAGLMELAIAISPILLSHNILT